MNANSPTAPAAGALRRAGRRRDPTPAGANARWLSLTLLGVCFAFSGWAVPADAGDNPPVVLPPWAVEERVDRQLQAAREDSIASTLGPTSVVTAATWSGRPIGTLADALRRAPGVMLQESFGGFEPPRLSIRGSGLDSAPTSRGIALLLDGLPLARADGSFHSGLLDPLLFSRIEVYRGTLHMALTPAVLGGVLNAIDLPAGATPATALRFDGGESGARRVQLSASTGDVALAASLNEGDGWREHSGQDRRAVKGTLRHALGPAAHVELSTYVASADYDVPGPLTLADALTHPRSVSPAVLRDLPRRDSNLVRTAVQVKSAQDGGTLAAGVAWQRLHDDFYQLQANGETDAMSDDVSGHATLSRRVEFAGAEHHLLARATVSGGVNAVGRFLNDQAQRGARFAAFDARARTLALSVEDIVWLRPAIGIGGGCTALHARRELDDRFATAGTPATVARSFAVDDISPRTGLVWKPRQPFSLHAAMSHGIEPPSFDDLLTVQGAFPNFSVRSRELGVQRATTLEFGAGGRTGRLGWNVTAYRAGWHAEILRLADAAGQPRGAVNAGRTRHEGLETALRWRIVEGPHRLSLNATSTLGEFRFVDDPVYGNNRIAGAPPHVGSAELAGEHPHGFFTSLESTWTAGLTPVDHAGRLTYGGHTLLHARLGWRRNGRMTVFLACHNIFDRTHIASTSGVLDLARTPATTTIFLPGVGRAFSAGFEWKR